MKMKRRYFKKPDPNIQWCYICKQDKPITEFHKQCKKCIPCQRIYQAQHGFFRKTKYYREKQKRYRVRYPEKAKAHQLVNEAILSGLLVKPSKCQNCGNFWLKLHGHHEDYSKPLNVMWLCHPCHRMQHRKVA